jgi:hypothetical protein
MPLKEKLKIIEKELLTERRRLKEEDEKNTMMGDGN